MLLAILYGLVLSLAFSPVSAFVQLGSPLCSSAGLYTTRRIPVATVCMAVSGKKTALMKAFQKPTGALTVSLEYAREEGSEYTENDLIVLSMQVRCHVDDSFVN